jgi:multidrug efflux pump
MALTISTGFVVDDAIVVIENITRYLEMGDTPYEAAMKGSREIGFTVLSMSTSLVAVFIPILLMGGIVGKLFREFAVTLSVAIAVSLLVSLTTTPMLCAKFLKSRDATRHGRIYRTSERIFDRMHSEYAAGLRWVLRHQVLILCVAIGCGILNVYLYIIVPKGFFPQQDTGRISGSTRAAQDISFDAMRIKQRELAQMVLNDPAIATVTAFAGGGRNSNNVGFMFIALKPLDQRPYRVVQDDWVNRLRKMLHLHPDHVSATDVVNGLRRKLTSVPGATLFLQANQDIQIGGRGSDAQYQYTLSDENLNELNTWAPQLQAQMGTMPELRDVSTDQQNRGLAANLVIDRDTAARLGITATAIDQVLYDAFGQRQVSTMYTGLNQYFVVMEVDPKYQLSPDALNGIYLKANNSASGVLGAIPVTGANSSASAATAPVAAAGAAPSSAAISPAISSATGSATGGATGPAPAAASTSGGYMVPLSTIAHYEQQRTSLQVNHQGQYPAITLTFNLAPNVALGDAVTALEKVQAEMNMPSAIHGSFQGTAQAFQDSLKNEKWLILAALVAVYIVLGILYESLIHPLTILSSLPPAGVGAILALMLTGTELSIIALIGIILLIGIVKKNAIMMIDFALQAERDQGLPPVEAIYQSCLLRFRPIMMTTMAALFGGMPLAIGMGVGSELRKPLGITIVGGLIVSQALTLFTTPVVYLFFDKLQWRVMKLHKLGADLEEAPGD